MNVKKCANGHFFDADKYQLCPHCGASVNQGDIPQPDTKADSKKDRHMPKRKKEGTGDPVIRSMPQKTMGKTFGIYDDDQAAEQPVTGSAAYKANTTGSQESVKKDNPATAPCPSCGKNISATARFCKYCGQPLERNAADKIEAQKPFEEVKPVQETPRITEAPSKEEQAQEAAPVREPAAAVKPVYTAPVKEPAAAPKTVYTASVQAEMQHPTPEISSLKQAVKSAVSGSDGRTIGFFGMGSDNAGSNDVDPVVGWLVCVKGKHFGESFVITSGRNSVGRGISNKIILSKDNAVSREKHAWITYEPKRRQFFIQPGESSGLTYLNDENIMGTEKLKANDKIEIGDGMYIMIPLCGDQFSWEDYIR